MISKKILLFFSIVLLLNIVSSVACYSKPNVDPSDGVIFVKYDSDYVNEKIYLQDNEDRLPAYRYNEGYSFRLEQRYYQNTVYINNKNQKTNWYQRNNWQDSPNFYYEYVDYLDKYEKRECYSYPPRDKLIYLKC